MFIDLLDEVAVAKKESGIEVRYNCPFCGEDRQKFYVQGSEPYLWHCKKCDRHGNPVSFVMKFYSVGFVEAKDILENYDYYVGDSTKTAVSEYYDSSLSDAEQLALIASGMSRKDEISNESSHYDALLPTELPDGFKYLSDNIMNSESYPYVNYLFNRNINMDMINYYNVGYVIEGGFKHPETGNYIRITSSIVFPTKDREGNIIYWNTRAISSNAYVKSINAPSDGQHYSKNNTIFNLYPAASTGNIVIFEGVFNAMMAGVSGVATFGKQVTADQIGLLKEQYDINNKLSFYVFLDTDAKQEMLSVARRIYEFTSNVHIVINPYKNKDANDLGYKITGELLNEAPIYVPDSAQELNFILS